MALVDPGLPDHHAEAPDRYHHGGEATSRRRADGVLEHHLRS